MVKTKGPKEPWIAHFRSQGNKTFVMPNFIPLLNVKMTTIVGILAIISKINTTSERLIAKKLLYLSIF